MINTFETGTGVTPVLEMQPLTMTDRTCHYILLLSYMVYNTKLCLYLPEKHDSFMAIQGRQTVEPLETKVEKCITGMLAYTDILQDQQQHKDHGGNGLLTSSMIVPL